MTTDIVIRDVPVVVEPGIEVIEASVHVADADTPARAFPVQLFRLPLDGKVLKKLPFVPSTTYPHVFSPCTTIKDATLLVIYDHMGRLTSIYKRQNKHAWARHDVFEEHVGRSIVRPSVRFQFPNEKSRQRFLVLADQIVRQSRSKVIDCDDVQEFVTLLARLRTPPVAVPVAVLESEESPL